MMSSPMKQTRLPKMKNYSPQTRRSLAVLTMLCCPTGLRKCPKQVSSTLAGQEVHSELAAGCWPLNCHSPKVTMLTNHLKVSSA